MIEYAIEVVGESLVLHADRALWWPARRWLMVADVHFGKGAVLRRAGVAVPTGQTLGDLARLDALIGHYLPTRLLVLGDLVHGRTPPDSPWQAAVRDWRGRHPGVEMALVAGNHDRHADPAELGFVPLGACLHEGPFAFCHEPDALAGRYVVAGHVHPAVRVRDGWHSHRLPAFRFGTAVAMLPAFGALTGLHDTPVARGERVVAATPSGLLPLAHRR